MSEEKEKICPNCGAKCDKEDKFCQKCGEKFGQVDFKKSDVGFLKDIIDMFYGLFTLASDLIGMAVFIILLISPILYIYYTLKDSDNYGLSDWTFLGNIAILIAIALLSVLIIHTKEQIFREIRKIKK